MGEKGRHVYFDPKLDEAVEKLMVLGEFNTKREASRRAGEIIEGGLNTFADDIEDELEKELGLAEEEQEEEDLLQKDKGIDHGMLGI